MESIQTMKSAQLLAYINGAAVKADGSGDVKADFSALLNEMFGTIGKSVRNGEEASAKREGEEKPQDDAKKTEGTNEQLAAALITGALMLLQQPVQTDDEAQTASPEGRAQAAVALQGGDGKAEGSLPRFPTQYGASDVKGRKTEGESVQSLSSVAVEASMEASAKAQAEAPKQTQERTAIQTRAETQSTTAEAQTVSFAQTLTAAPIKTGESKPAEQAVSDTAAVLLKTEEAGAAGAQGKRESSDGAPDDDGKDAELRAFSLSKKEDNMEHTAGAQTFTDFLRLHRGIRTGVSAQALKPEGVSAQTAEPQAAKQVADRLSEALEQGSSSFDLKLKPDGLGEINVKMVLEAGRLTLDIGTSLHATKALLEDQSGILKAALAERQVELGEFRVHTASEAQAQSGLNLASQQSAYQEQSGRRPVQPQYQPVADGGIKEPATAQTMRVYYGGFYGRA